MDQSIRLKHKTTEQECAFDNKEQADGFLKGVEDKKEWAEVKADAPAAPAELAPIEFKK